LTLLNPTAHGFWPASGIQNRFTFQIRQADLDCCTLALPAPSVILGPSRDSRSGADREIADTNNPNFIDNIWLKPALCMGG
jgi:hypothetical protein